MNLKIELGDFFEDYRKETLLFVNIEEKHLVSDVINYICEVCEIESRQVLNETICLFANGTYIPEKQPSLVLKEVKDVLSLRRQLNVRKISNVSNKSYSIKSLQGEKKEGDKNDVENCTYLASTFSPNNYFNDIKKAIPLAERNKDWKRQAELILNNETTYSNIPKLKRKKDKKERYDNSDILQGNEKQLNSNISLESSNNADVNNSLNHVELNLELSSPFVADHDIPMCLDDQNDTKFTSKRKKLKNKTKYEVSLDFDEGCIFSNAESIGSNKERECLLTPSINTSVASSNVRPKYNIEHYKESQIDASNDELIKEKFHDAGSINDSEDCKNRSISLNSFTNPQKRKRKRKHKKKSCVTPCIEISTPTSNAKANDNFQQKCKALKMMDNFDKKSKHVKFDSDEEESKLVAHSSNTTTIYTPISELQSVIYVTGNFSNQESPKYTNSLLCNNNVDLSSSLVEVHSVMPFTFQNIGKDPPSPSQCVDRSLDSVIFMPLLELEKSQDVSLFERKNLKPCLDSKNIELLDSYKQEPIQINRVPHSPPSPTNFNTKLNKDVSSELSHWEELEKSAYPHIYYRKKKETAGRVNNGAVTLNGDIISKHTVHKENFLGLPSSFTSGNSKCKQKELPVLNSCFTTKEQINDSQINGLVHSNTIEDGISFMGVKPKKLKEKKMYSSLGTVIKSLRNSKRNEIATDEIGINTINNLSLNHKEIDTVMVDKLDSNLKDHPKHKYGNNEEVMIGNGCNIHENFNNLDDKTAIANGAVKSEMSLSDSHSNVDLSLLVETAKTKEKDNLNYFYKSCPILPTLPNEGDIIAAKVMTLDETYSPCFSDYRPAKVSSISGLTLSLLFLDQGEFTIDELRKDKVTSIGKDGKICNLDWRDLKDVRLLFP